MKNYLFIFAKEPKKGKVKTKLYNSISEDSCLDLYKAFLKDTLKSVKRVRNAKKILDMT